jgi:predicted choloylglycine hydrolase
MQLGFRALAEDEPGEKWRARFEALWPSYKAWFLSEGNQARPTYLECRRALKEHMPELLGVYERLVDLAGGGDMAARYLSLYCPSPYLGGCSQVAWTRGSPALLRNYDYSAPLCEAAVLKTRWLDKRVIAMSDCSWGVLDGINEAQLAVSLAFGGRQVIGHGFGIPLVLRYVLEHCEDARAAARVLARIPVHMAYNVTAIDRRSRSFTAFLAPDRPANIREELFVATNHQDSIEWPEHAQATATIERFDFLGDRIASQDETIDALADRFLEPPLFLGEYARGWGTLYTAIYRVGLSEAEYRWKSARWRQTFDRFEEREEMIRYAG